MFAFNPDQKIIDKIGKFSKREKNFRINNLENFKKVGFPNKRFEDWKFIDFKDVISKNFKELNFEIDNHKSEKIDLIKDFDHNYIFLINGKLDKFNFDYEEEKNIKIEPYLNNDFVDKKERNPLVNLNNAFSRNGYHLRVKKGYKFKKILVIYHFFTENLDENILNIKNSIKIEDNSETHILELTINKSKKNFFCNVSENLILGKNSVFKNIHIQNERSNGFFHKYTNNNFLSGSNYTNFIFPSGLKFNKLDAVFNLEDENIECNLQSASFLNQNDYQEIKTRINHFAPNCKSFQRIKNVLGVESKGVYQGKIYVKDNAQKTDAYQLSKAILLDDNSEFDSKPELEIYADDVKCSHGSTSGNIDSDSIYYLMSRGLSKKESIKLLINGFLIEVIETIKSKSIKSFILKKMENQIYGY